MRTCVGCGSKFEPNGKGYRCKPCRAVYERGWRERRRVAGLKSNGGKMPREYHRAYEKTYGQKPEVKAKRCAVAAGRARDPAQRHKHEARWVTSRAIKRGRLVRQPCEVCGAVKVDAHHDDYTRPLDVRWLCRQHHADHHHAKAEGRQ